MVSSQAMPEPKPSAWGNDTDPAPKPAVRAGGGRDDDEAGSDRGGPAPADHEGLADVAPVASAEVADQAGAGAVAAAGRPGDVEIAAEVQSLTDLADWIRGLGVTVERPGPGRVIADLGDKVQFADGSVMLDPNGEAFLETIARRLGDASLDEIRVVGHTDHRGRASTNLWLSQRRAEVVAEFLTDHGVPREWLHSEGRGLLEPKVAAEQEWTLGPWVNRRIELELRSDTD